MYHWPPMSGAPSPESFSPLRFADGRLEILDQTRLPHEETWLLCKRPEEVADAIRRLSVRGAPAIGVAAAWGLVLGVSGAAEEEVDDRFGSTLELLAATRPTAVNLRWALDRGAEVFAAARRDHRDPGEALASWAARLQSDDVEANLRIGDHGAPLFGPRDRVLTHCNTGSLATAGFGTALGVVTRAWQEGRLDRVWVDETRPLLQGARLTTWELGRLGIPYSLITDSAAGSLMARGMVDRIVVGADRIAANGDVANKIGTYTLAVLADRHSVPFYVAAPLSTIDPETASGREIPIEERGPEEVVSALGASFTPEGAEALNPAFDVTPAALVSAIITDAGVLEPPYDTSISAALGRASGHERSRTS